jgi:hypothetical protein
MSAKSQTPVITVTGKDNTKAADEIYNILGGYFKTFEPEYIDDNTTRVDFLELISWATTLSTQERVEQKQKQL